MSPQAQALYARSAVQWVPHQPTPLPPQRQGLTDYHGPGPKGCKEAGQLLQCHYLQQPAYRPVRAGQAKGTSPETNKTKPLMRLVCKSSHLSVSQQSVLVIPYLG